MAKATKYGKVEIPENELNDENVSIRTSILLPKWMIADLKTAALNEKHGGHYQLLIKDVLAAYLKNNPKKKRSA